MELVYSAPLPRTMQLNIEPKIFIQLVELLDKMEILGNWGQTLLPPPPRTHLQNKSYDYLLIKKRENI